MRSLPVHVCDHVKDEALADDEEEDASRAIAIITYQRYTPS